MIFLDASVVVKAYLDENGSPIVHAIMARWRGCLVITDFVALEVLATFARRLRSTTIQRKVYRSALDDFLNDFIGAFDVIAVREEDVRSAMSLAHEHRRIGTGAMDLLHVSSARANLRSHVVVASSDAGFLRLADACGLRTFDPETEPLEVLLSASR